MSMTFNADEILAIAIGIEENGKAFYSRASARVKGEASRTLLEKLGEWETRHALIFQEMRGVFAEQRRIEDVIDPQGEAALYLQAIADGKIFSLKEMESELESIPALIEPILEMALAREKESIIFYLAMSEMVPPSLGREQVSKIIREEMRHVRFISEELDRVRRIERGKVC